MAAHEHINPQQAGMQAPDSERLGRLYGQTSTADYFGNQELKTPPFPAWETRSKKGLKYDVDAVHEAIRKNPPDLVDVDPRTLHRTQPGLTKGGVDYYQGSDYQRTGKTYADSATKGNTYPVVLQRAEPGGVTRNVLLSGHHRATAALFKGEPLRAIPVPGSDKDLTPLPHKPKT